MIPYSWTFFQVSLQKLQSKDMKNYPELKDSLTASECVGQNNIWTVLIYLLTFDLMHLHFIANYNSIHILHTFPFNLLKSLVYLYLFSQGSIKLTKLFINSKLISSTFLTIKHHQINMPIQGRWQEPCVPIKAQSKKIKNKNIPNHTSLYAT